MAFDFFSRLLDTRSSRRREWLTGNLDETVDDYEHIFRTLDTVFDTSLVYRDVRERAEDAIEMREDPDAELENVSYRLDTPVGVPNYNIDIEVPHSDSVSMDKAVRAVFVASGEAENGFSLPYLPDEVMAGKGFDHMETLAGKGDFEFYIRPWENRQEVYRAVNEIERFVDGLKAEADGYYGFDNPWGPIFERPYWTEG